MSNIRRRLSSIEYYASAEGGKLAFNISTGLVTVANNAEAELCCLINPVGSGKDIFFEVGEFGSSINSAFRRYSGVTLTNLSNPISGANMTGGSATSVAQMYIPPNYTRTGGVIRKTALISAYNQYFTRISGSAKLAPGGMLAWTIDNATNGTFLGSVYFEYWEVPAT